VSAASGPATRKHGATAGTGEPGTPAGLAGSWPRGYRGWRVLAGVVVVVVVVAGAVVSVVRPFGGGRPVGSGSAGQYPVVFGMVTRGTLISQTSVSATLGYAGSYSVINQAQGTYTALPAVGQVIAQGQVAYRVDGSPVVLLYGRVPAYRQLSEGMAGADVRQLNRDLVALGYATAAKLSSSGYFGWETAAAVEELQAHLGVAQTGSLSPEQAVFLPSAVRVTTVPAALGGSAGPGSPALTGTSTTRQVTISLDAAEQSDVRAGDQVTITLPDLRTTPGVITSVGTVATSSPPGQGGSGPSPAATIPVDVTMLHPAAAGGLDQAPVQVSITAASVRHALAVPVTALLATVSGGYQVQVAAPAGHDRFVPVSLGLFDDTAGLVQVTGPGLQAGQKVVEAQS
jgi:peptidoglycan hydrolase-like protein with peptidoglycan-binding domain